MANVLIVDDTAETCDMLARLFTRCGHTPVCLYGGAEVVAAMLDLGFDLVLLDVMMPLMDGFEVLAAIRANPEPRVARTPVAMYTAVSDPAQQERALAMGADEWIVKGTPFALLQKRLECFLRPETR
jgi:two-component system phosphate regulon response regulator PhoB